LQWQNRHTLPTIQLAILDAFRDYPILLRQDDCLLDYGLYHRHNRQRRTIVSLYLNMVGLQLQVSPSVAPSH
jgi:hypothetical protein